MIKVLNHTNQVALYNMMMKLSSGLQINKASDNAAGLSISEKLRSQYRGESVATRNMQDSRSLINTAEGALNSSSAILQRMRELSIQANNGLLTESDRQALQDEFSSLRDTLDMIGKNTEFNTKPLLDGSLQDMKTTTGANGETVSLSIDSSLSSQLGNTNSGVMLADVDLVQNPELALQAIDGAIEQISSIRSNLGATDNRLQHSINSSRIKHINEVAAESRIRDADIALSAMELQKYRIMQNSYFAVQRMGMDLMGMNVNLIA